MTMNAGAKSTGRQKSSAITGVMRDKKAHRAAGAPFLLMKRR